MSSLNVILIVVDALRADHVGAYGYGRPTTPNLDRFSNRSVVFTQAIASSAWTVPSMGSLFTSLDPSVHRALRYRATERIADDALRDELPTLAEHFTAAGYHTAGLLKSVVLDPARGFAQGFAEFRPVAGDMPDGQSAEQLTTAAISWLQNYKQEKPFFLYLHYMDPHSSYCPPMPWYSMFKGDYDGPVTGEHNQIEVDYIQKGKIPSRRDIEALTGFYDASVAYWDSQFGQLMRHVVVSGLDAQTMVVVVGDHGEALYEHGTFFEQHVYQENIHVPLIIKAPAVEPRRLEHFVQLTDVAPTLARLAGLPPEPAWRGRDQVGAMLGGPAPEGEVYAEYGAYRTIIEASGLKLIVGDGPARLYNVLSDPDERKDLAGFKMGEVNRMKKLLEARVAAATP